jgi:hypothetical protein
MVVDIVTRRGEANLDNAPLDLLDQPTRWIWAEIYLHAVAYRPLRHGDEDQPD